MGDNFLEVVEEKALGVSALSPYDVFHQLVETSANESSIYTEIHVGPDGQMYILPAPTEEIKVWASEGGTHSWLDEGVTESPLVARLRNAGLHTESVVAKGKLIKKEDGTFQLVFEPAYIRQRRYDTLRTGLEQRNRQLSSEAQFRLELTLLAKACGIEDIQINRGADTKERYTLEERQRSAPSIYGFARRRHKDEGDAPFTTGLIAVQKYTSQKVQSEDPTGVAVGTRTEANLRMFDAQYRSHDEVAAVFASEYPGLLDPVKVEVNGHLVSILAFRYSIDSETKEIGIELGIGEVDFAQDRAEMHDLQATLIENAISELNFNPAYKGYQVVLRLTQQDAQQQTQFKVVPLQIDSTGKNIYRRIKAQPWEKSTPTSVLNNSPL